MWDGNVLMFQKGVQVGGIIDSHHIILLLAQLKPLIRGHPTVDNILLRPTTHASNH